MENDAKINKLIQKHIKKVQKWYNKEKYWEKIKT